MAIHQTLQTINNEFPNKLAHIFLDYLNILYVIKTQIKHPMQYNNHPDKTILDEIVEMLQRRIQPTTMYKVRVHANIVGNEKVDKLAKEGRKKGHYNAINLHEFTHATPYFYQKDWWHFMLETPNKGPI